ELPDDAGHLVAVEFDDRVLHLDLGHAGKFLRTGSTERREWALKRGRRFSPWPAARQAAPGRRYGNAALRF
ncbi:MAG: hypothetical protein ABI439_09560, partial [Rhodospirillales bacterium]